MRADSYLVKRIPVTAPELAADREVLAVDIGATNLRVALVTGDGRLLHRHTIRTPAGGGPDQLLRAVHACLELLIDLPRDGAIPVGIGISALGPIDHRRQAIEAPANFTGQMRDIPVVASVADAFGLPVVLERDTNVAALGEATFGAARRLRRFVYLTVSSGVGSAIVDDGALLAGAHGLAGEIGHSPIRFGGRPCGCGSHGCLEAYASGSGIAAAAHRAVADGTAPGLALLAARIAPRRIEGRDVAEAADHGDPDANAIMATAREAFAAGMVGLVNFLDPGVIIVGGSVATGQRDRLLAPARTAVERHAYGAAARHTAILPAALGDDAGLLGAVPLLATR